MAVVTVHSDFGAQEKKICHCFTFSVSICHEVMGLDAMILGSKIIADDDCSHEIKTLAPWKESYNKPRKHIKKQRHHFADKGPSSQSYGFSSSHARI